MSFRILGTGMAVPEQTISNDDLSQLVDTNDEWIRQRVGVQKRHLAKTETAADLAIAAAKQALQAAVMDASALDLILVASISSETVAPSVSCLVQQAIGAHCMAFDLSAACTGFLFVLETAAAFFAKGSVKNVLVIGAERISRLVDWTDRSTCVIFGDGAGAAVLGRGHAYVDATFHVEGGDSVILIPNSHGESPFWQGASPAPFIQMQGQATFKFAVQSMIRDINLLLTRNHLTAEDIRWVVPHQANSRILELASRKLCIPYEKFVVNIAEYGNTSSASVPIALDELVRRGAICQGDYLILAAFGGGLASAAMLIRWEAPTTIRKEQ